MIWEQWLMINQDKQAICTKESPRYAIYDWRMIIASRLEDRVELDDLSSRMTRSSLIPFHVIIGVHTLLQPTPWSRGHEQWANIGVANGGTGHQPLRPSSGEARAIGHIAWRRRWSLEKADIYMVTTCRCISSLCLPHQTTHWSCRKRLKELHERK
jgi:hypothetical protein